MEGSDEISQKLEKVEIKDVSQEKEETVDLVEIARNEMVKRNLWPDYGKEVEKELESITKPAPFSNEKDLRSLLWSSIDYDDTKDIDQITYAEQLPNDIIKIFVAIADVDALVAKGSAIDQHAYHNTTSVYTAGKNFLMLPDQLSTGLSSLNPGEDRLAMVMELDIEKNGSCNQFNIYQAIVHNHAKLTYNLVGGWIEGSIELPEVIKSVKGLPENLQLQDQAAQRIKAYRQSQGSLVFETASLKAILENGVPVDIIESSKDNRAQLIIENFMIAANNATTRFLTQNKFPTLRRVVKIPQRWERIVELAKESGYQLPEEPSAPALQQFLIKKQQEDPEKFPDISLAVIKLMGRGLYILQKAGELPLGHFALALRDYSHSTAPNRRFADLVTHRLLKAAQRNQPCPYSEEELEEIARNCTEKQEEEDKVERRVMKSAVAIVYKKYLKKKFHAIVSGAGKAGVWIRLLHPFPPIEGKLVRGFDGYDVGDKLEVKLMRVNPAEGYVDFRAVVLKHKKGHKNQKDSHKH